MYFCVYTSCICREFKLAMRKVDAPGVEMPVVRLATARAKSMPDLHVETHLKVSICVLYILSVSLAVDDWTM